MKFHFAYLKLATFYTGIVMLISLTFSVAIFQIATREIEHGLGRQNRILNNMPSSRLLAELEELRSEQLAESNNKLRINLIYYNLFILILSALGSYFLAKKTLEPIEESVEARNRFTTDASHELKTPLTAMKSEIEVALRQDKLTDKESRIILNSNLEEIDKLANLSNALLKLARGDETVRLEFEDINIGEILDEAINQVSNIAELKRISINNQTIEQCNNVKIRGDKDSLVELFIILLDNAIKYSPKNSEIEIVAEQSNNKTTISVSDQGIGIKASDLPHVFDRFYRADHSRNKEKISGYGLGLSIAKQIVDLHKGRIEVESTPGKGSQFKVTL